VNRYARLLGIALVALLVGVLAPAEAQASPRVGPTTQGLGSVLFRDGVEFVGATAFSPAVRQQTVTLQLRPASLFTGGLYIAWVCEYDATGQVQVSDNVDGPWTRGPSERFSNGGGDIALFYLRPSFAPRGATVTISASAPTFISGSVAQYEGIPNARLVTASVAEMPASAQSTTADSGPTAPSGAGDLVFGALITGGLPGTVTLGSSQGRPLVQRAIDDSGSAVAADVLSGNRGQQHASFTLQNATDWYVVGAVFRMSFLW
jgi:hypothetical protein